MLFEYILWMFVTKYDERSVNLSFYARSNLSLESKTRVSENVEKIMKIQKILENILENQFLLRYVRGCFHVE